MRFAKLRAIFVVPDSSWVLAGGDGEAREPPVLDGPFIETKELSLTGPRGSRGSGGVAAKLRARHVKCCSYLPPGSGAAAELLRTLRRIPQSHKDAES